MMAKNGLITLLKPALEALEIQRALFEYFFARCMQKQDF